MISIACDVLMAHEAFESLFAKGLHRKGRYWEKPWSLVDGCTPVSPGCDHCWAAQMHHRFFSGDGLTESGRWTGKIRLRGDRIEVPRKRRKPTVFSIWNDLFHEDVPNSFRIAVMDVIRDCPQHIFLVLTKRPQIARLFFRHWISRFCDAYGQMLEIPSNLWLGVTAEDQRRAEERIPVLLEIPAGLRWVSIEPCLSSMEIRWFPIRYSTGIFPFEKVGGPSPIDWVVLGGETGSRGRQMHPDWARLVRDQCRAAGVPFWFKQWGKSQPGRVLDGRTWEEVPAI